LKGRDQLINLESHVIIVLIWIFKETACKDVDWVRLVEVKESNDEILGTG